MEHRGVAGSKTVVHDEVSKPINYAAPRADPKMSYTLGQ